MSSLENITIPEPFSNLTRPALIPIGAFEICIFSFNILVGFPTNLCTIWHITTQSGSEVASDAFILSLSICSLFYSTNCMIALTTKWVSLPDLLAVTQFLIGFAITGCPVFQCLISAERYLAVVHPLTFLKYKPLRYRLIFCAVAWTLTLASCVFCLLCFLVFSRSIYMWYLSVQFLVFFSLKSFLCLGVLRALKQSGPGDNKRDKEEENRMKRRAFYLILIITVNTTFTYLPFAIAGIMSALTKQPLQVVWSICGIFFAAATLIPPFLYLQRIGKITFLNP